MNAKSAAKYRYLTRIANHETRNIRARAIPYGSYTETAAANALVLMGSGCSPWRCFRS
jgi:hypothetical protein